MQAVLKKWGNSIGVRLPAHILKEVRLAENQPVEVAARKGAVVIRPLKVRRRTLASLLHGITPSNRHGIEDFGAPVGRESL
jgi:antitoxin MazE